jgi:hypothetical protein
MPAGLHLEAPAREGSALRRMTARTTLNVGDLVRAGDGEAEILGIS